jgi:hypothetical protein
MALVLWQVQSRLIGQVGYLVVMSRFLTVLALIHLFSATRAQGGSS